MIKKVVVFISLFNFSLNQDIVFPGDEIQMKIKIKIDNTAATTTTSAINVITSTPATTVSKF